MDFAALVFGFHLNEGSAAQTSVDKVIRIVSQLKARATVAIGFARAETTDPWVRTQYSKDNAGVALAVEYVFRNVLQYTGIVAVKLGRQVKTFNKTGGGIKITILLWWTSRVEQSSVFQTDNNDVIYTPEVVGED